MATEEARRRALLEALSLCGDVFLAARSAQVPMEELNKWSNGDLLFHTAVQEATADGRVMRDRVAAMRKVVEKHDETMGVLQRKADEFRKFEEVRWKEAQGKLL